MAPSRHTRSPAVPAEVLPEGVAAVAADGLLEVCNGRMAALLESFGADRLEDLPLLPAAATGLVAGEPVVVASGDGPVTLRLVTHGEERWLLADADVATQAGAAAELAGRRARLLGELAGAIVHDLANLLLAGIGIAEAARPLLTDEADAKALADMQNGVRQGVVLGRALARQLAAKPKSWRVHPLLAIHEDVVAIVRKNLARRGLELTTRFEGEAAIRVDPAEAVQGVVQAMLFCVTAGAVAFELIGGEAAVELSPDRSRRIACLRIVARPIPAAAIAQAEAMVARRPGVLPALAATSADAAGLALAALTVARAGGELVVGANGRELGLDFRWPAARQAAH